MVWHQKQKTHRCWTGTCVLSRVYAEQIHFFLLMNRQCKIRLSKWYTPCPQKERERISREIGFTVTHRSGAMCNFVEWGDNQTVIYKRYAGLFFIICVDKTDNELIDLEIIHRYGLSFFSTSPLLVVPPCAHTSVCSVHPGQVLWFGDRARPHLRLHQGL